MQPRLQLVSLALAALLLAGCGGAQQPGPAEVANLDQFQLTRPEPVEGPRRVPPLPAIVSATAVQSTPSPTGSPAPDPAATPDSEPAPAQPSSPSADPTSTGTEFARFTGRITVDGQFTPLPPLVRAGDSTAKDAAVCAAVAVPNESVLITDGGLADVFIYAKRAPAGVDVPPPSAEPVVLDQKGCRFLPQACVLRVEQPLQMINADPVVHNIRISGFTKSFNQTVGANDRTGITTTYDSAERVPVQTRCDFHTWMVSWHLPLEHPWAAVSAEDGTFVIDGLPAADEWEFVIWHNKAGYVERSVKFAAAEGEVIQMDFTVPVAELQ